MKHRTTDHKDSVQDCRDFTNECCNFTANECWFKHGNTQPTIEIESPVLISRLFEMMEKFTERMEKLETQLYN